MLSTGKRVLSIAGTGAGAGAGALRWCLDGATIAWRAGTWSLPDGRDVTVRVLD